MAAVGLPVWTANVWADTVWEDGVWAEAGSGPNLWLLSPFGLRNRRAAPILLKK